MTTQADNPKLAEYARKLRWALSALPEADRDGIVAEMRSHVLDRVDAGATVDEALAALGTPDEYAREFRESYTVASALSSRRTPQLLSALLHNVLRSAAVAVSAFVIFIAWAVAAMAVYLAALKITDPAHVGLWPATASSSSALSTIHRPARNCWGRGSRRSRSCSSSSLGASHTSLAVWALKTARAKDLIAFATSERNYHS